MSTTPAISAIHLAPLHPTEHQRTPSGLSHKDSFLSTYPGEAVEPKLQRKLALPRWNGEKVESVIWAIVPLVFHGMAILLLLAVLLSNGPEMAFMTVKERAGTGRLEYHVLGSCAIKPGTTERICTSRNLYANFLPSLTMISPSLPGFSALKLPFYSHQTPSIMLTSLCVLVLSLLLYLPLWTLVYFPHTPLPPRLLKFIRYHSRPLFYLTGAISFLGFIFTLSIGIGYKLWFLSFMIDFETFYKFGVYRTGSSELVWNATIGKGFDAVWAATVCAAMTVVGINISLHNGLDERVEWPKDLKEPNTFGGY